MTKQKYTPGPWRVRTDNDAYIRIDAGGEITNGPTKGDPDYDNDGQTLISEDFYLSDSSMKELSKSGKEELIANFTLAAAAPELLEALNLGLEYWRHRQQRYKNRSPVWVEKARAAIAKATGEAA